MTIWKANEPYGEAKKPSTRVCLVPRGFAAGIILFPEELQQIAGLGVEPWRVGGPLARSRHNRLLLSRLRKRQHFTRASGPANTNPRGCPVQASPGRGF